jgi:hypothetical protein
VSFIHRSIEAVLTLPFLYKLLLTVRQGCVICVIDVNDPLVPLEVKRESSVSMSSTRLPQWLT